jgi:hypothetical protein
MKKNLQQQDDEISLKDMLDKILGLWNYLVKKWVIILVVGIVGGGIGLAYALLSPVKYEARVSFVVEDSKSQMGGIAALAGQFGFDFGGSSGGGVFSGENILLFLKSESLCRETLLTHYDSAGNKILADVYAEANGFKAKWAKDKEIGQINFSRYGNGDFPRLEDSLMQVITKRIQQKDLAVSKPDKKATFIEVNVTMRDELLSKYFSERLVNIATNHYVESKTKVKSLNVAKLQHRADSIGALLVSKTYTAAASQQSLVDLNPALRMVPVTSEISARDKTMIATIFAEVVKNLEIAKVALNQETPTIQMVDQSTLPLKEEKVKKVLSILGGAALTSFLFVAFLLLRVWWKSQLLQQKKEPVKENDRSADL